jgi:hypothetical protein
MSLIKHVLRVANSVVREIVVKESVRQTKWTKVRKAVLKAHPYCAVCGGRTLLQVHHLIPPHLRPELELEPKNLIVLCMGSNECHLLLGHGNNFKKYNPYIAADARNAAVGSISLTEAAKTAKKNAIYLPVNIS